MPSHQTVTLETVCSTSKQTSKHTGTKFKFLTFTLLVGKKVKAPSYPDFSYQNKHESSYTQKGVENSSIKHRNMQDTKFNFKYKKTHPRVPVVLFEL